MVLLLVAASTFLLTNESVFKADVSADAKIEQGVYIGGIDVSGMTAEEATNAVNAYVEDAKAQKITLVGWFLYRCFSVPAKGKQKVQARF